MDESYLDDKYFIDEKTYNCPFCNRNNVRYSVRLGDTFRFDFSEGKECYGFIAECKSCEKRSLHLSYEKIFTTSYHDQENIPKNNYFHGIDKIDQKIFASIPTSFFVMDERVPKKLRDLISEAQDCLNMNLLTGASACIRKSIYELIEIEEAEGDDYDECISSLKENHPDAEEKYFEIIKHIKDMASDQVHEESWEEWDSEHIRLFLKTLRAIYQDIYVTPEDKKERRQEIIDLRAELNSDAEENSTNE